MLFLEKQRRFGAQTKPTHSSPSTFSPAGYRVQTDQRQSAQDKFSHIPLLLSFVFCPLPLKQARSRTNRTTMQQGYYFSKTSAFDSVLPVDTRQKQRGTAPAQNGSCWSGSNASRRNVGTNHFLTMKNPFKQQDNSAASVQAGMSQSTPDQPATDNFPTHFENRRPAQFATRELRSPEAESFRAFIKSRLPREKAPQALMNKIRLITKTPA